jgi:hypothetical protein
MKNWELSAVWVKDNIRYHVIKIDLSDIERKQLEKVLKGFPKPSILDMYPHYNGYCTFKHRPLKQPGYHGIVEWVPVHGGITYAEKTRWGYTYGFDTAHAGDEGRTELRDPAWLTAECEKMAQGILAAAKYEKLYQRNPKRAALALHAALGNPDDYELGFGAMISVMCGIRGHTRPVMLRRAQKMTPPAGPFADILKRSKRRDRKRATKSRKQSMEGRRKDD